MEFPPEKCLENTTKSKTKENKKMKYVNIKTELPIDLKFYKHGIASGMDWGLPPTVSFSREDSHCFYVQAFTKKGAIKKALEIDNKAIGDFSIFEVKRNGIRSFIVKLVSYDFEVRSDFMPKIEPILIRQYIEYINSKIKLVKSHEGTTEHLENILNDLKSCLANKENPNKKNKNNKSKKQKEN